jgi:hypothetical protein
MSAGSLARPGFPTLSFLTNAEWLEKQVTLSSVCGR